MENEETKGEITANRFVAFIDILGFKDMVLKNPHDYVLKKIMDIKHAKKTVIDGTNPNMRMDTMLQSVLFSDTILIFSVSDTVNDLVQLLHQIRILIGYCYSEQIPLKGAISFGNITANFTDSVFLGQPIIDAYLLQEELHMLGIILDHHAENKMNEFITQFPKSKKDFEFETIQYKVPTKNGKINHYCLTWPLVVYPSTQPKGYPMIILHDRKTIEGFYRTISGKPRIYVDNTLEYIDHLVEVAKIKYPDFRIFQPKQKDN